MVQPLQHQLRSQHSQHCACLGGFENLLGLLLCQNPGFRLPSHISAFCISLWLHFKSSGRPRWFHEGGFLCRCEPYLKLPYIEVHSFIAGVDVVLDRARTPDWMFLNTSRKTWDEKNHMKEELKWAELSFFKYFKYSVTQAVSPRFGMARIKEEAYHIWLLFQNSHSVCSGRGVRSNPVSLDVLSANVADVIKFLPCQGWVPYSNSSCRRKLLPAAFPQSLNYLL